MAKQEVVEGPVYSAGRREDIEAELDALGLEWRFNADGDLADIDMSKSLANQARLGEPLNEERVETYAEAIKQGAKFPAIVVDFSNRKRKGIICDGNHRAVASEKVSYNIFARYEITKGDPSAITLFTFRANVKHGLPNSLDDRVGHAIWLIESGVPQTQALRQLQIPATAFKRAWAQHQADQRADEVGIDRTAWEALTSAVRQRLLNLSTDDAFLEAAKLSYRASLGADEVFELVAQLNSSRSWSKQESILRSWEKTFEDRIREGAGGAIGGRRQRRPMTPKQRWNMTIGQITGLPEPASVVKLISAQERADFKKRLTEASKKLSDLASAL